MSNRYSILSAYAEDFAWHAMGFAQGLLDLVTVAVLALAIVASGLQGPAPQNQMKVVAQVAAVCSADCITAQVLKPQDS